MAKNFLSRSRHKSVYYFRRRVPVNLSQIIGKPFWVKPLATSHRGTALMLARAYASKTDWIHQHLRAMNKSPDDELEFTYSREINLDEFGSMRQIKVDATPEETVSIDSHIKTTLQHLPLPVDRSPRHP